MKGLLAILLFLFSIPRLNAQFMMNNWGVADTSICLDKSTAFVMPHDYIELFNESGVAQPMVWVLEIAPDWPVQWEAGFTDPDSVYANVLVEDTGYFVMPYPIEFSNQLILNIDHNNHQDTSYLRFKVYPESEPSDSLWLTFCVIIHAPDAGVQNISSQNYAFTIEGNQLMIQGLYEPTYVSLSDSKGSLVYNDYFTTENSIVLPGSGVYFLQFQSASGVKNYQFFVP